jgi:hypothetical protein
MSNKVSISNEQCLTEEQLFRYAEGVMTRDEERVVDRHIASCDMCSDAVEGAMMIPVQDFKKHSASIGKKIDKTFDKVSDKNIVEKPLNTEGVRHEKENATHTLKPIRSFRLLRWMTVAAASILVLATAGVWLLTTDAPPSQDAKSASTETAIEPTAQTEKMLFDTATSSPSGSFSVQNNSANVATVPQKAPQIASKPIPANEADKFADVETEAKKDNAPTPPVSYGSAPKPSEQPIGNQAVKEETANDGVADLKTTKREQETDYVQSTEPAKSKMKVDDRMASADKQSKASPATATSPASAKMVSADEQHFQKGMTYFNQQDYGNALTNFSKVKQEKVNSDLYQQVQWLSALAQLKQGNKPTAKSILETIVAGKGKYAAQATEVLKTSF